MMHKSFSETAACSRVTEGDSMSFINVDRENSHDVSLYVEDHGQGEAVVLIHGWPLNGASFEKQAMALVEAGYRVITYDRRGFGLSNRPSFGYDYDTFANDLNEIIIHLGLETFSLFGFSMGGGEVARYIGKFGSDRLKAVGFLGSIAPFLLKTPENPTGVEKVVFDGIIEGLQKDRFAFLKQFFGNFFNADEFRGKRISSEALEYNWLIGCRGALMATIQSVTAWQEDFRKDLQNLDIPVLIVHGTEDKIVPIQSSAEVLAKMLPQAQFEKLEGAPHGFLVTHADETTEILKGFLAKHQSSQASKDRRTMDRPEARTNLQ
jgi:non-heme chloroperoxidase